MNSSWLSFYNRSFTEMTWVWAVKIDTYWNKNFENLLGFFLFMSQEQNESNISKFFNYLRWCDKENNVLTAKAKASIGMTSAVYTMDSFLLKTMICTHFQ